MFDSQETTEDHTSKDSTIRHTGFDQAKRVYFCDYSKMFLKDSIAVTISIWFIDEINEWLYEKAECVRASECLHNLIKTLLHP
jgi:hypothetical protein